MFSLLEATDYFGFHNQISEPDIRAALGRCPQCVEEWMQYSEDKRTMSGWYVARNDEGCYEIGHLTERGDLQQRLVYKENVAACAAFVKRELENIRLG